MITWDTGLRLTAKISDKAEHIKKLVEDRSFKSLLYYCLVFSPFEDKRLEICNMGELLFRYYRECEQDVHVIGIAESKAEAASMLTAIVGEVYDATGDIDVRSYFRLMEGLRARD